MMERFLHLLEGDVIGMSDERLSELHDALHTTLDDGIHAHSNMDYADRAVTDDEHWTLWDRFYAIDCEMKRRRNGKG